MNEIAKTQVGEIFKVMENVIADGDLSKLSAKQRVEYYNKVCESLGLNTLTRPFEYQRFNGKVVLYARKECTEQLRFIHKVSITKIENIIMDGVYIVTAYAETACGKKDAATGAVTIIGLKGEALSNAIMKAETKAKRRVTLSICGLGFTDESEIASIPNAQPVKVNHDTGEIIEQLPSHAKRSLSTPLSPKEIAEEKPVMAGVAIPRIELVEAVAIAKNIPDLKRAFANAYRAHAENLELMKDITALKDNRLKQLENYENSLKSSLYSDQIPTLPERAEITGEL
jgi:hypothetical protein